MSHWITIHQLNFIMQKTKTMGRTFVEVANNLLY